MTEYEKEATDRSKALIVYFFAICLGVAIFSDMHFGRWWLLILPVGMFAISLAGGAFAAIYGLLFRLRPIEALNSSIVMIVQFLIGTFGSYYALKLTNSWIS